MKRSSQIESLRAVWLFERCSHKELTLLASNTTQVRVPAGKTLTREGERGHEFFVIISGKAEATSRGVSVATLGTGDFFGEMALLESQPRIATVTTTEPTEVLVLNRQEFTGVIDAMPSVDRKMLTVLAARLRDIELRYLPADERLLTKIT
ncbi:MAG TPA: cyclic nucleotide-binding domain-containing protein [Acidimicrobiia bacterium]|nr:cyclic nucleotide-binding domain-containing protein [Acidimicrobiia bacterium]